ncbi:OsmC family protein [Halomonas caseinilytica]|uniref:OsmC family protein n=1 Tax=Halomonas caseinilytica TaxID=438744 RepID=UPI0007E59C4A|nr:OsmC family protein [Halomonas caseinilytica]SEM23264.1 putative redox protein [Halomonas caseinilytica]
MSICLRSERNGRLRERATIDGFEDLLVGVPEAFGGDGQAPDPHDYFDLSLGACKAITARMYAQRKGWPLEGVEVTVKRDERDEARGVYRLEVVMSFHGDLDEAQRERLEDISDKCPIHRLMTTSDVEITTRRSV